MATSSFSDSGYLLDLLLLARDDDEKGHLSGLSDQELHDEAKTFLLAGHETTSQLLSWCVVLLGQHPAWKERVRFVEQPRPCESRVPSHTSSQEAQRVLPTEPADISFEHVSQLEVTAMVINETLRMFPPVPAVAKRVHKRVQVGGLTLPEVSYWGVVADMQRLIVLERWQGLEFVISIMALHHDPGLWDSPEEFKPERFERGVTNASRHPLAFMPFR